MLARVHQLMLLKQDATILAERKKIPPQSQL